MALLALPTVGSAAPDTVSYAKDIQPILKEQCYVCHGDGAKESDLDLRTRESILQGGKHGLAVVPGKPSESLLYLHVSGSAGPPMPLGGALEDEQIMAIRDWVEQGAPFDVAETSLSEGDNETWWAFQPPVEHTALSAPDSKHPIDAFVFSKLADEDLTVTPRPTAGR